MSPRTVEAARELVLAYGWNTTSYQILNPGIRHWFASGVPGVIGYARRYGVLLAAGAPVCAPEVLPEVCGQFEAFARRQHCRVCYVCGEERLRKVFAASPKHATIALGAQPAWDPRTWPRIVEHHASLRAQLHRCRNKGVSIEPADAAEASNKPELHRVLNYWLEARRLPPLHFLVEPQVLGGVVKDRILLIARQHRSVVAFLVASPVPAKNGYLVELLARSPAAPNGASELLIDAAMERFAAENRSYVTLGLVALAHAADPEIRQNPFWLRALMQFARLHANRFYNFRGLEQFRVKMKPELWETVSAISNEPRFSMRTLYAVGAAFSGIPPWQAIAMGMGKALRQECQRAVAQSVRPA